MKGLVLSSTMVPEPVHYRYAWGRSPLGNLQAYHNTDIPVATQRSDEWPIEEVFVPNPEEEGAMMLERKEGRQLKAFLGTVDDERRLKEAEAVVQEEREK